MLRGLYTAAAGMIAQQQRNDTITNNINNLNTPGYKAQNSELRSFPEMLMLRLAKGQQTKPIGSLNSGVMMEENVNNFQQGSLKQTQRPFDFAIQSNIQVSGLNFGANGEAVKANGSVVFQPQAYFTVQDGSGNHLYTRDGNFTVNGQGQLVTSDGYQVLGKGGNPIVLTDPATGNPLSKVRVNASGQLFNPNTRQALQNASGQPAALMLSRINSPNQLIPQGNGAYQLSAGASVTPVNAADDVSVKQGYLEQSNVNSAQSMTGLMDALRMYQANQQVIRYTDRSLNLAANEVGKING